MKIIVLLCLLGTGLFLLGDWLRSPSSAQVTAKANCESRGGKFQVTAIESGYFICK